MCACSGTRTRPRRNGGSRALDATLKRDERLLRILLLGFALFVPVSISLSEPLAYAAVPVWMYGLWKRRDVASLRSPFYWPVMLFIVVAIWVSFWGIRPEVSLMRCHRLFLLFVIFMIPAAFESSAVRSAQQLAGLFILGASARAVFDVGFVLVEASRGRQLYDAGNMRDPQMFLIALCLLLAGIGKGWGARLRVAVPALLASAAGLVMNFKRGVWFAFVAAAVLMGVVARRYRMVAGVLLCAAAALLAPQVRDRLDLLRKEWSTAQGGRYALWTQVAPELLHRYPTGMGYGAVVHEDLLVAGCHIQPRLNHVHDNVLQIAVELGWAGLAIWLVWMAIALVLVFRDARRFAGRSVGWLSLGLFGALSGLLLNGLVEYNFGDSEILMAFGFLMGLSVLTSAALREDRT